MRWLILRPGAGNDTTFRSRRRIEKAAKPYGALEFAVIAGVKQLVNSAGDMGSGRR